MFDSNFEKGISSDWFYCSNPQGNFEMTLELFGYQWFQFPVYELSPLWSVFFQQLLFKIENHTDHIQKALRGFL